MSYIGHVNFHFNWLHVKDLFWANKVFSTFPISNFSTIIKYRFLVAGSLHSVDYNWYFLTPNPWLGNKPNSTIFIICFVQCFLRILWSYMCKLLESGWRNVVTFCNSTAPGSFFPGHRDISQMLSPLTLQLYNLLYKLWPQPITFWWIMELVHHLPLTWEELAQSITNIQTFVNLDIRSAKQHWKRKGGKNAIHGKNPSPRMRKPSFLTLPTPSSFADTFLFQPMFFHLFKCKQFGCP